MNQHMGVWAAVSLSLVASACGGVDPGYQAGDADQHVASTEQELTAYNRYAIGVIMPDSRYCAADSLVSIYTDDEDSDNESDSTEFEPTDTARRARQHDTGRTGTLWQFCKVDGRSFKSLTRYGNTDYYYAALKLGTTCPNGSIEFQREIAGETSENESYVRGPAGPNVKRLSVMDMSFCMFGTNTDKMYSFPDLDMPYAVFHDYDSGQPSLFFAKRWVYSDEEDAWNRNSNSTTPYGGPDFAMFDNMVGGSGNTMFDIAQVR